MSTTDSIRIEVTDAEAVDAGTPHWLMMHRLREGGAPVSTGVIPTLKQGRVVTEYVAHRFVTRYSWFVK